jgi:Zn-dependent alcohol dehydrogenase
MSLGARVKPIQISTSARRQRCLTCFLSSLVMKVLVPFQSEVLPHESHPVRTGSLHSPSGAGIVLKTGSKVTNVAEGDHGVITYNCCGKCKYCTNHETSCWFRDNFGIGRGDGSRAYSSSQTGKPITSHFFGQSSFASCTLVGANCLVKVSNELPWTPWRLLVVES